MKEVAATTPLSLERYPFCAALHWIVVAARVFCSLKPGNRGDRDTHGPQMSYIFA
jgi:hypothetical protein